MPTPSNDAFRRTGRSVAYTEALRRNRDTVAAGIADGGRELTWVELAADVYGDTTDDGATPQVWSVDADDYIAATDGDGDTITATVRDTTGLLFGAKGDWVLCASSRQSDDPQTILELVWAAELIVANTTGDVAASDPSFDVTTPGGSTLDDVDNWAGWCGRLRATAFHRPGRRRGLDVGQRTLGSGPVVRHAGHAHGGLRSRLQHGGLRKRLSGRRQAGPRARRRRQPRIPAGWARAGPS